MRKFFAIALLCALASLATACSAYSPTTPSFGDSTGSVTNPVATPTVTKFTLDSATFNGLPASTTLQYPATIVAEGTYAGDGLDGKTLTAQLTFAATSSVEVDYDSEISAKMISSSVVKDGKWSLTWVNYSPCLCKDAKLGKDCPNAKMLCTSQSAGVIAELYLAGTRLAFTEAKTSWANSWIRKPSGKGNQP